MPALFMAAKACRPVPSQPPPGLAGSMTLTCALAAAAKSVVAAMHDRRMLDSSMSAPKGFVVIGNNSGKNRLDQDVLSIRERERAARGCPPIHRQDAAAARFGRELQSIKASGSTHLLSLRGLAGAFCAKSLGAQAFLNPHMLWRDINHHRADA